MCYSLNCVVQGQDGRRGPPGDKVREDLRKFYSPLTAEYTLNSVCLFTGWTWTSRI